MAMRTFAVFRLAGLPIALLALLAGCEGQTWGREWPPDFSYAIEHFVDHQDTYEELAARIRASDYVAASGGCIYNKADLNKPIYQKTRFVEVFVDPASGEEMSRSVYVEDQEWATLLCGIPYYSVEHYNDVVWFDLGRSLTRGKRDTFVVLFNDDADERLLECQPQHRSNDCGLCNLKVADHWHVRYVWSPSDLVSDEEYEYDERGTPLEDYSAIFDERLAACRRTGYAAMGYDLADLGL